MIVHVDNKKKQLSLGNELFQLEGACGRCCHLEYLHCCGCLLLLFLLLLAVAVAVLLRRAGPGSGWLPSSFLPSPVSLFFHLPWVSQTQLPSRTCSAACGPLSTRIHHAKRHHVMCLFDTSFSSCIEFATTRSSCVVRALPGNQLLFLLSFAPPELSLLSRSS